MAAAANLILAEGLRDRSFAGLFPYETNTPQKVFAGNQPYVPVSTMVDALDALQKGKGPGSPYAAGLYQAAVGRKDECRDGCMQTLQACGTGNDCMQQAHSCAQQCGVPPS